MRHRVTIEGSQYMPTDLLGRGQRATVEVTPTIRQLVASGGATVVAGSLANPDGAVYGEPVDERTDSEREADLQAEGDGPDSEGVPAGNASRERWARFLDQQGIEFSDDDGRDELRDIWAEHQASGES
ncbi:hypothetical protein ABQF35_14245 [Mycobacterium syngnathidarum]